MVYKIREDEEHESHPSSALISINRRQGNPGPLFGSVLKSHESSIMIAIRKGTRISENGYDRYYGSISGDIVEVEMSAVQFAELITTQNVGTGVPCTLRRLAGESIEKPPEHKIEVDKARDNFQTQMSRMAKKYTEDRKKVAELLEKKSLTKADKEEILRSLSRIETEIASNAPFALQMFEEAAEKVVAASKAEIDSVLTHNIIAEGIRSLVEQGANGPKQLPETSILKGAEDE